MNMGGVFVGGRSMRLREGFSFLAAAAVLLALFPAPALAQPAGHHVERGPINLPEVVKRSAVIVRGNVASSRVEWVDRTIYTFHDLVVGETIKGAARTRITIAVPGGAIGNVRTDWPGAPAIRLGDELVFFGNDFPGRPAFAATGLFDGLVEVRTDPGTGNRVVASRGRPERIEDFLAEVRALSRR